MADDIVVNPGAGGATLATDEIGGRHFELVKLTLGALDANDGPVSSANPIPSSESRPASSVVTSVGDSASNVTLLAANAARKGASVFNDSGAILYLKLGATATTASFTVKVASQGFYEIPHPCYTGIVDGIWASDAGGAALVTELS